MPPRDVAPLLRLSPNNVAQLAVRARSRLRERYVQVHVRNHATGACLEVVEQLGRLAAGELPPPELTRAEVAAALSGLRANGRRNHWPQTRPLPAAAP
jgi:hypothetical protein